MKRSVLSRLVNLKIIAITAGILFGGVQSAYAGTCNLNMKSIEQVAQKTGTPGEKLCSQIVDAINKSGVAQEVIKDPKYSAWTSQYQAKTDGGSCYLTFNNYTDKEETCEALVLKLGQSNIPYGTLGKDYSDWSRRFGP
jgi:hypothetical protein